MTIILSPWAYIGLMAVSLNWIDATTPLDNRLLMPVYLNILLLLGIAIDITAIYFLAGKDSVGIPNFKSEAAEFETIRANLRESGGFLMLFGELTGEFVPLEEITCGMTPVARFDDGAVYKLSP